MRRALALWLLLFGVYAATLGFDDYSGDEPHYLLAVESLAHDGDVDVSDEYAARALGSKGRHGKLSKGRLDEPYGIGFPLLILPAYALAGTKVSSCSSPRSARWRWCSPTASRCARRPIRGRWAPPRRSASARRCWPTPPPSPPSWPPARARRRRPAGAQLDERAGRRRAFGCFCPARRLPWLGVRFLPAGAVIGVVAARAIWRSRRRTLAIGAVELALFSVALAVGINEALYDGPTPYSACPAARIRPLNSSATSTASPLPALFVDPGYGLLRWAPLLLLAFVGLWWLWRSRRDDLARVVSQLHTIELTAGLCAAVFGVQLAMAALFAPTANGDGSLRARHLIPVLPLAVPLVALGLRRLPRVGVALALITSGSRPGSTSTCAGATARSARSSHQPPSRLDEHARLVGVQPRPVVERLLLQLTAPALPEHVEPRSIGSAPLRVLACRCAQSRSTARS